MKLRTVYRLHRWIAVFAGTVLLAQLVSGVVMVLPPHLPKEPRSQPLIDYHSMTLSPADALGALVESHGGEVRGLVRTVDLRQVVGQLFYEVSFRGGGSRLVDAQSGDVLEITPDLAARIAGAALGLAASVRQVERLEQYDLRWRRGALPVYRVTLEDPGVWVVYVSAENGAVEGRSNRWSRVRGLITSFHELQPVSWFLGGNRVRKAVLLLFAFAGIATTLTGYYLALPRGQDSKRSM